MAPLCKGGWLRRQPEPEGLLFCFNTRHTPSVTALSRYLPLHMGDFDLIEALIASHLHAPQTLSDLPFSDKKMIRPAWREIGEMCQTIVYFSSSEHICQTRTKHINFFIFIQRSHTYGGLHFLYFSLFRTLPPPHMG